MEICVEIVAGCASILWTSKIQQKRNKFISDCGVDAKRTRIVVLIYASCVAFDVSDNRTVRTCQFCDLK